MFGKYGTAGFNQFKMLNELRMLYDNLDQKRETVNIKYINEK